jgi:cytochrome b561
MDMSNVALIVEAVVVLGAAVAIGRVVMARRSNRAGLTQSQNAEPGSAAAKYHPLHVVIHWFIAFAMANLLLRGALIMVNIPNSSPDKISGLRAHMFAGILVLILMVARVVLLKTTRMPPESEGPTAFLTKVRNIVHPLLYVSIFIQVFAGLGMAYQADLLTVIYAHQGALPESFWIYPLRTVHYVNSRILMALISLHISGALFHTFILKDGLIRRMSFGRRWLAARAAAIGTDRTTPAGSPVKQASN